MVEDAQTNSVGRVASYQHVSFYTQAHLVDSASLSVAHQMVLNI